MGPVPRATCQHGCAAPAVPARLVSCAQSTVPAQTCTESLSLAGNPDRTSEKSRRRFCSQSEKLTPWGLRSCGRGELVTSVAAQLPQTPSR